MSGALGALVRDYWCATRDDDALVAAAADDPALLWRVVLALVDAAPDDGALAVLGAGLIEAFVDSHGAIVAERLDGDLARHPRLLTALASTWASEGGGGNELNLRVQQALARAAAAAARGSREAPPGTRLVAERLVAPGPCVVVGERLFWSAAADYRSPDAWLCLSAACTGGDVRVHGAGAASFGLAAQGSAVYGVGSCGVWRMDAPAGTFVERLVIDETLGAHVVCLGEHLYWTVSSLVRTVPRTGAGLPRSAWAATSPRGVNGVSVVASMIADRTSLVWTQLGGEVVRAVPGGDEPRVIAAGEDFPRSLQAAGEHLYWLAGDGAAGAAGGAAGASVVRRLAPGAAAAETIAAPGVPLAAFAIPASERYVYSLDASAGILWRSRPGAASGERVATGLAGATSLTIEPDVAYVTLSDAIVAVGL